MPATLSWSDAVALAAKLRGIGQAIRG
jgi:hypothetical protein